MMVRLHVFPAPNMELWLQLSPSLPLELSEWLAAPIPNLKQAELPQIRIKAHQGQRQRSMKLVGQLSSWHTLIPNPRQTSSHVPLFSTDDCLHDCLQAAQNLTGSTGSTSPKYCA